MIPLPPRWRWIRGGRITRPIHVAASPYKTGTTSLGRALVTLGVGRDQMPYEPGLLKRHNETVRRFNRLAGEVENGEAFLAAHGDAARSGLIGFTRGIAAYDIFPDMPMGHIHLHPFVKKAIAPQARLIWIHRAFDEWLDSVRRWEEGHPETYVSQVAMWREDPAARRKRLQKFWGHQLWRFRKAAETWPEDCLELNLEELETMDALAAFYGRDATGRAFPKRNVWPAGRRPQDHADAGDSDDSAR